MQKCMYFYKGMSSNLSVVFNIGCKWAIVFRMFHTQTILALEAGYLGVRRKHQLFEIDIQ